MSTRESLVTCNISAPHHTTLNIFRIPLPTLAEEVFSVNVNVLAVAGLRRCILLIERDGPSSHYTRINGGIAYKHLSNTSSLIQMIASFTNYFLTIL